MPGKTIGTQMKPLGPPPPTMKDCVRLLLQLNQKFLAENGALRELVATYQSEEFPTRDYNKHLAKHRRELISRFHLYFDLVEGDRWESLFDALIPPPDVSPGK